MLNLVKKRRVDSLVEQFWKYGYFTVKRRYGKYLPEPSKVGKFDVDVIARYKKRYAIGITLSEDDMKDFKIWDKVSYLANRKTKFSNKKVLLFIGVPEQLFKTTKEKINLLNQDIQKNIRVLPLKDKNQTKYENDKKFVDNIRFN